MNKSYTYNLIKLANKFDYVIKKSQSQVAEPSWVTKFKSDKKNFFTENGYFFGIASGNATTNLDIAYIELDASKLILNGVSKLLGINLSGYKSKTVRPLTYKDPSGEVYVLVRESINDLELYVNSLSSNLSQTQKSQAEQSLKALKTQTQMVNQPPGEKTSQKSEIIIKNKEKLNLIKDKYKTVGGFILAMNKYMDKEDPSDIYMLDQMKKLQIKINDVINSITQETLEVDVSGWISKIDQLINTYIEHPAIQKAYGK